MIFIQSLNNHFYKGFAAFRSIFQQELNDHIRIPALVLIMATVGITIAGIAFIGLYQAAFEQQKIRLQTLVSSQRNLIEAVAQFDTVHNNQDHTDGAGAATISQVNQAFQNVDPIGSEDILLARRSGDTIQYLTRTHIQERSLPKPVAYSKDKDQAMYMALSGLSGVIRARELNGEEYLVAFDYIPSLKAGILARLSIRDIQRPFIIAGLYTSGGAFFVILFGVFLFRRISSPLIQRMEKAVENLATAQRIAHIGSWTWDIVGGGLNWSDEIYRLFGHAPQSFEATYEAFLEAIHPEDRQLVQDAVGEALVSGSPYSAEHRILLPDGSIRYAEEQGEVIFSDTGEPIFMNGVVNDITEQKLAEQKIVELNENLEKRVEERTMELEIAVSEHQQTQELLLHSEARMKAVVGTAPDGIITIDEKGSVSGFNTAAEKIFGWSVTQVIGKNISLLMPDSDAEHHDGYLTTFQNTNKPKIIGTGREILGKHKDGNVFPIELAVSINEVGDQRMFTGIIRDISERKEIEAELERNEKKLRDTLDNMPGAIIFTDEENKVAVCNNIYSTMCEVPEKYLVLGTPYEDALRFRASRGDYGPGDVDELVEIRMKSLQNPGEFIFEDLTPSGRFHEIRRRPAAGGGVVTVITDITERKQAEDKLREAMDNLKRTQDDLVQSEKMASLGGLVAGVAHEINTPVGISVTAASHLEEASESLKEKFSAGDMKKSDLIKFIDTSEQSTRMISSNLKRAAELIGSFKQVAVDQSSQEKRTFSLSPYLEEVLMSLHPQLKLTKHQVSIDCAPEIELDSYPGALSQVVTNLVMNSIIHGFEKIDEGDIRLAVIDRGSNIEINYTDNGCGMDKDVQAKIFDPFFTTKRGSGGSGLGMNILYNLITQTLKGTVTCKSEPNNGTQFSIILPKCAPNTEVEFIDSGS